MKIFKKQISINILSTLLMLMSVFILMISPSNSWFTDERHMGIVFDIKLKNMELRLYQIIGSTRTNILTNEQNEEFAADENVTTNPQYLILDGEIVPDVENNLHLVLKNEDDESEALGFKFKFQLFSVGVTSDKEIACEIKGFDVPGNSSSGYGFAKISGDASGFYYYQDSNKNNVALPKNSEAMLMQKFVVPYSEFIDANGNILIANSETVYVKLTIEAFEI